MKKYRKIKEARMRCGYTLEKLGKKLHVSKQYLWDLEDGRRVLSYHMAYKISVVLNMTPDELFLEESKRKP